MNFCKTDARWVSGDIIGVAIEIFPRPGLNNLQTANFRFSRNGKSLGAFTSLYSGYQGAMVKPITYNYLLHGNAFAELNHPSLTLSLSLSLSLF